MKEHADILIKDGLIITMNPQRQIFDKGAVVLKNKRIVAVGKTSELEKRYSAEQVIDASKRIVLPGLICAHTHLYGTLLRGAPLKISPPSDFAQILQRVWWPMDEAMTQHDAYASAAIASLEFLKTGTTCFADTYSGPNSIRLSLDSVAKAVEEVGIRGIIAFEATERHSVEEGEEGIRENVRFIEKVAERGEPKVTGMFSLHASFTCSDNMMKRVRSLASRYKVTVTIHTSEGLVDVYHNLERYGKRTVDRLHDIGLLGPDVILAHCVHVDDDEIRLIRETGAKVAHNPMSNMLNAVGVAPIVKMLREGIPVGLGNDGYIFDGFENIRAAYLLHKMYHRDPRVITPEAVLEMATLKSAELYGVEKELGSLEVGKKADLIIVSLKRSSTPVVSESVYGHLINTVSGRDVETVIVDGKVIMEKHQVKTVDEEKIVETVQSAAKVLWEKLGAL